MTEEVIEQNSVENALQAEVVVEPPIVDPVPEPEVVEETPPTPVEDPAEAEDKRKNPWFLKRISAEAEARRVAEQRAADAEAMLQRLQAGKEDPALPAPNAPEFQTAVKREAASLLFEQDRQALIAAGQKDFGLAAFNNVAAVLGAAGAATVDFIQDVMAVDKANAHKILAMLADDPERATALAEMDPRRRTAELTRISMTATPITPAAKTPAVPARQVSRAPAPPPPVEPSASKTVPWYSDDASDAEFDKGFYSPDRLKKRQRL